ncbi:YcxB family protein [Anaerocolumna jejuensis]|uniref:YcxB family protein n=1 Tax=Anaerocolumna jejuensis TaxID=259063 RepID=UPI003F7C6976
MKTLQLVFKYTQSEYVKAERQYLILNKTIRKYDPILATLFLLFSISCIFLSSFSVFSIIILGIVLIATAIGSYLYFLMPVFKFKYTEKYHEEYIMVFSKDSIKWITPSIESELKWNIYSELWESNDFYYLIQVPRMYMLIPKRAFAAQKDKQTFEEIALSSLKSIKRIE